ncbi:penicillin acylase family protein [Chitinophaga sp. LS1]|uniref:penicillin acylase family protein n=1 Tax=Chitinophaga sp. LS1 TaxID=3051176 RepID=UPI002AAC06FD|nr:penicillin acylase family protein [Chitinophaga sp. LS1]WPV65674.1 penicillin acylase family protein [Chitinophaga sp. LS1]
MKRIVVIIFLFVLTGVWLFYTNIHFNGINSIQGLSNFRNGILNASSLHDNEAGIASNIGASKVYLDTLGIPHIYGSDINSTGYALGYMHARDRYFQMELLAYTVMGRLSEIVGEQGIASDKHWRIFDLEKRAEEMLDSIRVTAPELATYLTAYEKGANDYLKQEDERQRDPMFTIWGVSPRPWKASYTFLMQWYLSHDLTYYDDYFNREEILEKLPDTLRSMLYPVHPDDKLAIIPGASKGHEESNISPALVKLFGPNDVNHYPETPSNRSLGSNNWVVGGKHTTDGQVFLCNDLHLVLAAPNIFYEVALNAPGLHAYGYTIPGVPLILTGHNEKIAWGITNSGWDVTEQYLLKTDDHHKDQYFVDGKWEQVEKKKVVIHVKDGASRDFTIQNTLFGPLLKKDSIQYALRWHPQQSAYAPLAFWRMMQAADWNGFRTALKVYDYPAQNFVFADTAGDIGVICAGKMPLKPAGYNGGLLDGTKSPVEGYISFDSLPQTYNPEQGYLYTANQEPQGNNYYFSSRWYDDLYRPARIQQMISSGKQLNAEDMRTMQLDIVDLSVKDLKQMLTKYKVVVKPGSNWDRVLHWNGELNPGTREAVFYRAYLRAMGEVGKDLAGQLCVKQAPTHDQLTHFLLEYDSVTVKGKSIVSRYYFNHLMSVADSIYSARYGDAAGNPIPGRAYVFSIPQITQLPGFEMRQTGIGGSENTINVNYTAHPVIRTLIEIKDGVIHSRMINAVGQTGRVNDENYAQQLPAWKENRLHNTQLTRDPRQLAAITDSIVFSHP